MSYAMHGLGTSSSTNLGKKQCPPGQEPNWDADTGEEWCAPATQNGLGILGMAVVAAGCLTLAALLMRRG